MNSYNNTPHRSLGYKLPSEISKANEEIIWMNKIRNQPNNYPPSRFKFGIGQMVRIAYKRHLYDRDYYEKWTTELFRISAQKLKENLPLYRLVDLMNDTIDGYFAEQELQYVNKNENVLWNIDKILKKRKRKGRIEYLVSFQGYPSKFNSYIPESDIKNIDIKQNELLLNSK